MGLQVSLDKTARNTDAHKRFACKMVGLDKVVLGDVQAILGHHHNQWWSMQRVMGP